MQIESYITGHGNRKAKMVLLVESPTKYDMQTSRLLNGSSGNLISNEMIANGFTMADCYVTSVIREPLDYKNAHKYYDDGLKKKKPTATLRQLRDLVLKEILEIKPNVIMALGSESLVTLTGIQGINDARGCVIEGPAKIKVIPTYSPSSVLAMYSFLPTFNADIRKAVRHAQTEHYLYPKVEFLLRPSIEQIINYLDGAERLSFDIETSGEFIRCIGLAKDKSSAICIPFTSSQANNTIGGAVINLSGLNTPSSYWSHEEEYLVLRILNAALGSKKIRKIAQNFPFDATRLEDQFGIRVKNLEMDTMVAQHCCYSELPKGLDYLASIYTEVPYYWNYSASSDESTWTYNCWDVVTTMMVADKLKEEMESLNVYEYYKHFAEPYMIALAKMQSVGIDVNLELREKIRDLHEQEAKELLQKIRTLHGSEFNPNSPKQVKEQMLLLGEKKAAKGADVHVLTEIAGGSEIQVASDLAKDILKYRKVSKLISAFLDNTLKEGRMVTNFHATGTKTGRLSSSSIKILDEELNEIDKLGGNMQQIPRGPFRRIYVAPPGFLWVKADLSQAEARAVAWDAKIEVLIKNFQNPEFDIHTWNAAENILHIPMDKVTKEDRQRSKAGVHGGNYGLGETTASIIYQIPRADAKLAIESYKDAVNIYAWWDEIQNTLKETRTLRTPFGRQRIFMDRIDQSMFRSAYSFKPQGTVADIIGRAIMDSYKFLVPEGGYPILQVHDEIDFIVPEANLSKCLSIIKQIMEFPVYYPGIPDPLVIPVEISYGPNWFDQKDWSQDEER